MLRLRAFFAVALLAGCGASTDILDNSSSATSSSASTGSINPGDLCTKDSDCSSNQGCLFEDAACSGGHCAPLALSDCGSGVPMCKCDGTIDEHACPGQVTPGEALTIDTSCMATFPCGFVSCHHGVEYCASPGVPGDGGMCDPLPEPCTAEGATCDCFSVSMPGCACSQDDLGNFRVLCAVDD